MLKIPIHLYHDPAELGNSQWQFHEIVLKYKIDVLNITWVSNGPMGLLHVYSYICEPISI